MHSRFVSLLSESLVLITILIDKTIYNRLIKSNLIDIIFEVNSINAQLAEIRAIIIKFCVVLLKVQLKAQLKVLESFKSLES